MKRNPKRTLLAWLLTVCLCISLSCTLATSASAAISSSTYDTKVSTFIADSRWKNGISWGDSQTPKLSSWSSYGCCAYVMDFCKYVYGTDNPYGSNFTTFTSVNSIKTGDIIYTGSHWFVVLYRNGNNLYTAEGNFDDQVRVATVGYYISDGKLYQSASKAQQSISTGYHYSFSDSSSSDSSTSVCTFSSLSGKVNTTVSGATIALKLNKPSGSKLTACGARLYNSYGDQIASASETPSSTYSSSTYVDMWYAVASSLDYTVQEGRTYYYTFWATVDGATYTSDKQTFKVNGTASYTATLYTNDSDVNYLTQSGFTGSASDAGISSRDTSVYTVETTQTTLNGLYSVSALKITGTSAGSSGHDLAWCNQTNGSRVYQAAVGDSKSMILSFWARSSVENTTLYLRYGYESSSDYETVTLSTSWAYYTVTMDKTARMNNYIHLHFDTAGVVLLAQAQLEDGSVATTFSEDSGSCTTKTVSAGSTYSLTTPTREGYTFDGWYTAKSGGTEITSTTSVLDGDICLYAHWTENSPAPDSGSDDEDTTHTHTWDHGTVTTAAACTTDGVMTYTCSCGASYTETIPAAGHTAGTAVKENVVAATATADGSYDSVVYCTACGKELSRESVTIAATGGSSAAFLFDDVTDSTAWYYDAVYWAYDLEITKGYDDGVTQTFKPNNNCTRAEFATFLYTLARAYGLENAEETASRSFTDVAESGWYYDYVMWAAENGIVSGYSDGTFRPNNQITRAEAVTMLYGFYKTFVNGGVDPEVSQQGNTFSDLSDSAWYYNYMMWAIQNDVVSGYTDGTCRPTTSCTRSVMVVLLYATAGNLLD